MPGGLHSLPPTMFALPALARPGILLALGSLGIERPYPPLERGEWRLAQEDGAGASSDAARARALVEEGLALARAEQLEAAIDRFDRALKLDPDCVEAYEWRGWSRSRAGQHVEAIADFSRSIELAPANSWSRMARGEARLALRDLREAASDFLAVLRLEPEHLDAHARLGMLLGATTGEAVALEHLDWVLAHGAADRAQEVLWRWVLARELGRDASRADADLAAWLETSGDRVEQEWERALARFDLGSIDRETLFAMADEREAPWTARATAPLVRVAQSAFHAAVRAQLAGEAKQALRDFHRALETFALDAWEWEGSRCRLRRLAERHVLPPWLGFQTTAPDARFAALARLDAATCRAITAVDHKSFAGRVGLQPGDVILTIEGGPASEARFGTLLDAARPGDLLRLELLRGAERSRCALLVDVRMD